MSKNEFKVADNPIWKRIENVAQSLSDEDLNEVIIFAAYLHYRRRVFKVAHEQNAKLAEKIARGEWPNEDGKS